MTKPLQVRALTAEAFKPYGVVIEAEGTSQAINSGTTAKFSNVATVELDQGARAAMHIYRPQVITLPHRLRALERHPLASQAFVPLGNARFVAVVVTANGVDPKPDAVEAFVTDGKQGVQFATNVWHHPFLALDQADFLIVDRFCEGPAEETRNLDMIEIAEWGLTLGE